jgi:hypothetical protein
MEELGVRSGQVVALRLFDLAYEIDLRRAEEIWARRAETPSTRGRLSGTPPKAVSFGVPPLTLDLGAMAVEMGGYQHAAAASVRLYDFGIAALGVRLPAEELSWAAFTRLVNETDRAIGPLAITDMWTVLLRRLRELLADALGRPTPAPLQEDYLIALVNAFNSTPTADELQQRLDLVPLLAGEDRPLSDQARRDLLRHRFSYYQDDMVVLTWDRAFIYEPRRETDVAEVIEMANAQLLEMRTYDEMLDDELPRVRRLVEATRRGPNIFAARAYGRLARQLRAVVAEVTESAERVDNALQVTEDVYLARVYAASMELFRVASVNAAIERKLAIIRETYTALHDEAAAARAELLEIAVVLLIVAEVVLSLRR